MVEAYWAAMRDVIDHVFVNTRRRYPVGVRLRDRQRVRARISTAQTPEQVGDVRTPRGLSVLMPATPLMYPQIISRKFASVQVGKRDVSAVQRNFLRRVRFAAAPQETAGRRPRCGAVPVVSSDCRRRASAPGCSTVMGGIPARVTLCTPDDVVVARVGRGPAVKVTADAGELLLLVFGRTEIRATFDGDSRVVDAVKAAKRRCSRTVSADDQSRGSYDMPVSSAVPVGTGYRGRVRVPSAAPVPARR